MKKNILKPSIHLLLYCTYIKKSNHFITLKAFKNCILPKWRISIVVAKLEKPYKNIQPHLGHKENSCLAFTDEFKDAK